MSEPVLSSATWGGNYLFQQTSKSFTKKSRGERAILTEPAMTRAQAQRAVGAGIEIVLAEIGATRSEIRGADIVGTGDMGIGNTDSIECDCCGNDRSPRAR